MQFSIARINTPTDDMVCNQCGLGSDFVGFATSKHRVCLVCESDTIKSCPHCKQYKPLTSFSISVGSAGQRTVACKACRVEARKSGKRLGASCTCCGVPIKGEARGSKRYCDLCAVVKREKRQKAHQVNTDTPLSNILKMRW